MFEINTNEKQKEEEVSFRHAISSFFAPLYIDPNTKEISPPSECYAQVVWPEGAFKETLNNSC